MKTFISPYCYYFYGLFGCTFFLFFSLPEMVNKVIIMIRENIFVLAVQRNFALIHVACVAKIFAFYTD